MMVWKLGREHHAWWQENIWNLKHKTDRAYWKLHVAFQTSKPTPRENYFHRGHTSSTYPTSVTNYDALKYGTSFKPPHLLIFLNS